MFLVLQILCMKRLKIILQHNAFYYVILCFSLIYFIVCNSYSYSSVYDEFNLEEFVIVDIKYSDEKTVYTLKGKEKVIGNYYGDNTFSIGDVVKVSGEKYELSNNSVPNTFNYKRYLYNQGIYNFINIKEILLVRESNNIFYKMKNFVFNRSHKIVKSYGYINGLLLGNSSSIDSDVKSSYQENGISHLFAISGLHISLFVLMINFVLKRVFKFVNIRYMFIILFLLFYMFLTGYSMSVMRSAIFTIFLYFNRVFKLNINTRNVLIFTFSFIVFINPMYLYNIGLQFSFVITFYLICFSKVIKGGVIKKLFITSLISFLVGFPIVVNNFYQVNVLSVIYNLFFVPYVSYVILPLVILTYIFPFFDSFLYVFIVILERVSLFLNGIDICKVIFCKMSISGVIIYYLLITFVLVMYKRGRKLYFVFIFIFMIVHYFMPFDRGDYYIMFDVGQGDSSMISVNNEISLIDTGGIISYDGVINNSVVKNKIIPYLKSRGIRKIDNLIISHGDYDHMGDSIYLVNNFRVDNVYFNCGKVNDLESELIKVLNKKKIKYYSCVDEVEMGNYRLKFLNTGSYDNENDSSLVIYFNYDDFKFLLMGDAGEEREKDIMEKYSLGEVDFLKVGHHCSSTSSGEEFINSIKPKYSLISVGKNNRYGHPKSEVLDVLEGSKVYRTDVDGSIFIKLSKKRYSIETCEP